MKRYNPVQLKTNRSRINGGIAVCGGLFAGMATARQGVSNLYLM